MPPTLLFSLVSIACAIVFFCVGFAFGRTRGPQPAEAPSLPGQYPPPMAERTALQRENLELRKAADNADALRSENRKLRGLAASVLSLRSENVALKATAEQATELRTENEALVARVAHLEKLRGEMQVTKEKAALFDELHTENQVLRERLASNPPKAKDKTASVEFGGGGATISRLELRQV